MNQTETENHYQKALDERKERDHLRHCVSHLPTDDSMIIEVNGKPVVNFSSNDYLGLSRHPEVMQAGIKALEEYGTGTNSSRLITGTTTLTTALEEKIANWYNKESALVFPSGYQANISILPALFDKDTLVFADRLNHASLLDGMTTSHCKWQRYNHCDMNHLEDLLKKAPKHTNKWIVTDSVFSMDGDFPDFSALVSLAKKYNAKTYIDEAHGVGVFGNRASSGLCEHFGVTQDVDLIMGTFSKALGGSGAFITGSQIMIDYLINFCRGFIYTTALPPSVIAGNLKAIEVVQNSPQYKNKLWENINLWNQHSQEDFSAQSPIVPILIVDDKSALQKQQALLNEGLWVHAIRPPTVPEGKQCLRISLSSSHSDSQIISLQNALNTRD